MTILTKAADKLAARVIDLVDRGIIDARSPAADQVLDYAALRFGDHDPIGDLRRHVASLQTEG